MGDSLSVDRRALRYTPQRWAQLRPELGLMIVLGCRYVWPRKGEIMKRLLVAAACLLLLAGCASPSAAEVAEPKAKPSTGSKATPSAPPKLPAVSLETTCFFLFGNNVVGPMPDAADIVTRFVANPDLSTVTQAELDETISSLTTASSQAQEEIQPFIDAQVVPLQAMKDALTGKKNSNIDFTAFKASGIELLNNCKPYL